MVVDEKCSAHTTLQNHIFDRGENDVGKRFVQTVIQPPQQLGKEEYRYVNYTFLAGKIMANDSQGCTNDWCISHTSDYFGNGLTQLA